MTPFLLSRVQYISCLLVIVLGLARDAVQVEGDRCWLCGDNTLPLPARANTLVDNTGETCRELSLRLMGKETPSSNECTKCKGKSYRQCCDKNFEPVQYVVQKTRSDEEDKPRGPHPVSLYAIMLLTQPMNLHDLFRPNAYLCSSFSPLLTIKSGLQRLCRRKLSKNPQHSLRSFVLARITHVQAIVVSFIHFSLKTLEDDSIC